MVTVGIGDENLTEVVARHQLHDCLHSLGIQLVEDVIQEEQRRGVRHRTAKEIKLRQLQCEHKRLVLSLTSLTLHLIVAYQHLQVIPMHTMQRVAHGTILEPVSLNHIQQRTSLTMRHIPQLHLLTIARNMLVDALEHRQEFLHEGITLLVEEFAIASHLPLPDFHQGKVGFLLHLQESVALL